MADVAALAHNKFWDMFTQQEHFAIYALAIYDWIISLDNEVDLLRSNGVRPAKVAFVMCRYWPLLSYPLVIWVHAAAHSRDACQSLFRLPMYFESINFLTASLVMMLRVHAFMGQRLVIGAFLFVGMFGVGIFQVYVASAKQKLANFGTGCLPQDVGNDKFLAGFFIAPLFFDLCALLIMGVHALRMSKFSQLKGNYLTRVFLRDGLLCFFLIAACHVVNVRMNLSSDKSKTGLGVPLSVLLPNILACRMVLNLRHAVEHDRRPPAQTTETERFSESFLTNPSWLTEGDTDGETSTYEWGKGRSESPLPLVIRYVNYRRPPPGPVRVTSELPSGRSRYSIPIMMGNPVPDHWRKFASPEQVLSGQDPYGWSSKR